MASAGVAFALVSFWKIKEDTMLNRFGHDLAAAIGWVSDLTIDASNIVSNYHV